MLCIASYHKKESQREGGGGEGQKSILNSEGIQSKTGYGGCMLPSRLHLDSCGKIMQELG